MFHLEIIEGEPEPNSERLLRAKFDAERWKYNRRNPLPVQMIRLAMATIHETSEKEAARRLENLKANFSKNQLMIQRLRILIWN